MQSAEGYSGGFDGGQDYGLILITVMSFLFPYFSTMQIASQYSCEKLNGKVMVLLLYSIYLW